MSEHIPHDPWASLAESLGASPSSEPSPPRPAQPPKPAPRPRSESRPRPAPAAGGDWDALASDLGIGGPAAEPPRPAPRPTAPPPRQDRETGDRAPRVERHHDEAHSRDEVAPRTPRAEDAAHRDHDRGGSRAADRGDDRGEEGGERRGRRRRGRRGGRGRGRRDGDRAAAGEDRGSVSREPRDREFDDRPRGGAEGEPRPQRQYDDEFEPRHATRSDEEPIEADLFAPADDAAAGQETPSRDGPRDEEDRPRRRRRRGRRGGRGRARGDREPGGQESGERREPPIRAGDEHDDEPLPSGYGVRPAARPDAAPRGEGEAARTGDDDGDGRGRRRRRRRRGEGRSGSGREAGGTSGSNRSAQGRRGRRPDGELRSSSSTLSRGRRADFAPVAGGYDEDEEGLEFLGIEEAGRESPRRDSRPEDDEILAESGLDSVRDVPSWVEAIGIVIAGNLDARSKPRGEGGRR